MGTLVNINCGWCRSGFTICTSSSKIVKRWNGRESSTCVWRPSSRRWNTASTSISSTTTTTTTITTNIDNSRNWSGIHSEWLVGVGGIRPASPRVPTMFRSLFPCCLATETPTLKAICCSSSCCYWVLVSMMMLWTQTTTRNKNNPLWWLTALFTNGEYLVETCWIMLTSIEECRRSLQTSAVSLKWWKNQRKYSRIVELWEDKLTAVARQITAMFGS